MEYIDLLPCPICGAHPDRNKTDMGQMLGRGYPNHNSYQYKCEKCKILKSDSTNDIYDNPSVADARARISWNKEVYRVLHFMEIKNRSVKTC